MLSDNYNICLCLFIHDYIINLSLFIVYIQVGNILKDVEFIFVPFVNPDGYEVLSITFLN